VSTDGTPAAEAGPDQGVGGRVARVTQSRPAGGEVEAFASSPRPLRAFVVSGLDCPDEVAALRRAVGPAVDGADNLTFDLLAGRMMVAGEVRASDASIVAAAAEAGLSAVPVGARVEQAPRSWSAHLQTAMTAASAAGLLAGLATDAVLRGGPFAAIGLRPAPSPLPWPVLLLYLAATAAGFAFVVPRALTALRARRADMNLLMTVAVVGAIAIGQFLEAATVSFLFALSLRLEAWSVRRARLAVRGLLDLAPPRARRIDPSSGNATLVPAEEVMVGDRVLVVPGERVPVDGAVVAGRALVDASPVTGESAPRETGVGDEVWAGVIALDGALTIEVSRAASDTVLARIVRRVAEAGRRRSRAERWVDRFARVYTPSIFAGAVLTALLPPLVAGGRWEVWGYRALVLLVVGCPCALVISTPVSVLAGIAAAARHGVLIKGGDVLEVPARLAAVALDKTGTLTVGAPEVVAVIPLDHHDRAAVLRVAAALEQRSVHPIAAALLRAAHSAGGAPPPAEGLRVLPGRGVEGVVGGRPVWVGSHRLLEERGVETPELHRLAEAAAAQGRSVVVVGADDHVCGLITLADRPRPGAAEAVAALRRLGVDSVVMLTGDNRETAEALATEVGVDRAYAGLLPDDKITVIESLQGGGGPGPEPGRQARGRTGAVAFVGDGINDAPALAAATLGVAMGVRGSDVAVDTADVALMSDDLLHLPWLVRHSRRVVGVVRANVVFALAVKAAFVLAALVGYASLWAAIAADMGVSLLVIFNGLRLLRPAA
jgi:Zn2+/Cd2+-exporting ATPase